jgi:hypothetical protein
LENTGAKSAKAFSPKCGVAGNPPQGVPRFKVKLEANINTKKAQG